jgi:cellulose synthase operon protein YhjQ
MTERPADPEQSAMPEDIATLYSRANVQGSKYWDFSASRKEARGEFRHRLMREEAEQAGGTLPPQPGVAPPSLLSESGQNSRFQAPPFQTPQFEPPRSGPVRVPEAGPHAETRAIPDSLATAPPNLAAPCREAQPLPRKQAPNRWFAVHSVFSPPDVDSEAPLGPQMSLQLQPPMLAVFSLAGGVGKTCLVATLGRALSALGEHVLLADTAVCGLLPFYFGAREFKLGVVRNFSSPASSTHGAESDAAISVLSLEAEHYPGDGGDNDALLGKLLRDGRGVSRILVDIATARRDVTSRLLRLRPTVLVPILPDMSSLAGLGSLEAFLAAPAASGAAATLYLLNEFDASLPLHLEVRETLQHQLGDRLLPFVLRRSPAFSEALAEGMTVIDYAPNSAAAEDYWQLAGWLRNFAAPAMVGYGGVRWSER